MKKFLAIDLGYSNVKVSYYNETGVLQFDKYISAVAKVDNPMEIDDDVMFTLGVDTYILGTPALKVPRSSLLKLENFEDMKAAYPVWVSYLLKKYGGIDKFDKVIIGLSMAFTDRADELLQHLYDVLMIQKDDYFVCLPQGLSCKLAYSECGLDIREKSKQQASRLRSFLILDGGFLTCDICTVAAGKASSGGAVGIPDTGVICIAHDIQDYLWTEYQLRVSVKEAQVILNDGKFTKRGKEYDISDKIDFFTKSYLAKVLNLLEERFSESLDAVEGILVCGGLAYFFQKYINDPEMVKEIERHFPTSFLVFPEADSEFYNVYSYLKYAENHIN